MIHSVDMLYFLRSTYRHAMIMIVLHKFRPETRRTVIRQNEYIRVLILILCNTGRRHSHKFFVSSLRLRVLNDDDDLCSGTRNGKLALYSHYPQYLSPFFSFQMMFEAFGFSRALSAVQNNISATFGAPALVGSPALTDTVSFFRCHCLRSTILTSLLFR